jgi:hypothetical protein
MLRVVEVFFFPSLLERLFLFSDRLPWILELVLEEMVLESTLT